MADPRLPFGFGLPPELLAAMPQLTTSAQPNERGFLPGNPMFGQQGFSAGLDQFGPELAMQLAPMALGPLGRVAGMAPRTAAGGAALLAAPSVAGGQGADAVRQLQEQMRDAGYYRGPIDGVMGRATQEAKRAFDAAEAERTRTQADRERTQAERAETERRRLADEQRARERAEGEERLRQAEESVPWYRQAIRDYGPPLGYALGLGAGLFTRGKVKAGAEARSADAANRADALMQAPPTDLPGRVGRVNQFWGEGGAGANVPFRAAPGLPRGFVANPNAPPAASLYQQPGRVTGTDIGVMGGFGVESGISQYMEAQAHERLATAQERVRQDPSEVNIRELQKATDLAALFEGTTAFGRMGAAGYGIGLAKGRPNYSRPNVSAAESARLRIDRTLGGGGPGSAVPPAAPLGAPRPHPSYVQERIPRGQPGAGRFKSDE